MSAPKRIWLQDAGDYDHAAQFEVTWCAEPQDAADTEYVRADVVRALARTLRDLMAIVEDARADEDVDAMDPGGAWLCGDEMHYRMGAARASLIAIEGA